VSADAPTIEAVPAAVDATAAHPPTVSTPSAPATPPAAWRDGPDHGTHPVGPRCTACRRASFAGGDATREAVSSPEAAAALLVPELADRDREHCLAALLDTKHRLIEVVTVSIGSVDHTFMAPRELFRDALLAGASALVVGHNHPSGDPEPSADDERLTRRLVRAGEVVGVGLLDHLVVGRSRWVSLARRGLV
jgi:DNA repair protein RadC